LSEREVSRHALVVGARGLIGGALQAALSAGGWRVTATARRCERPDDIALDLSRPVDFRRLPPDVEAVFLLAGVTSLRACQEDPTGTALVNVAAPAAIAEHYAALGARSVMISTNLVFDGTTAKVPRDAPRRPTCEYGRQKAALERKLLALTPRGTVLRITKIAETLIPLLSGWKHQLLEGRIVHPFSDLRCAPLRLADAIRCLVELAEARMDGIIHCGSESDITYIDICRQLADYLEIPRQLVRGTTAAAAGIALSAMPQHTTLDMTGFAERFGFMPAPVAATLTELFTAIGDISTNPHK
jgi:dTDP-4-dehydrorhamnose reductase